jgi:hypothetical protein
MIPVRSDLMNSARIHLGALPITMLLFALSPGCDDGKPSVDTSKREAKVSGIVRVKGKPLEGGTILFNPSNSERIVEHKTAPIGKDGTYTITTYTGGNVVTFDADSAGKGTGIGLLHEYVDVKPGVDTKKDFDLLGGGEESAQNLPFPIPEKGKSKGR